MTNTVQYTITAGPSREDLFDSLRLGTTVVFETTDTSSGKTINSKYKVYTIGIEDGSRQSWLVTFYEVYDKSVINAYYRTDIRTGFIKKK